MQVCTFIDRRYNHRRQASTTQRSDMKPTYTIDINSTPENVSSWLGTPERAMEWQSNISRTEILHETSNIIGTTFREIVEENERGAEMSGVVTDYRENQALAMHLGGKYNNVDVEYHHAL